MICRGATLCLLALGIGPSSAVAYPGPVTCDQARRALIIKHYKPGTSCRRIDDDHVVIDRRMHVVRVSQIVTEGQRLRVVYDWLVWRSTSNPVDPDTNPS